LVEAIGQALSSLGKGLVPAFIAMARQLSVPLPAELNDPEQPCHPAASSASSGTSPAISSRSWPETRRTCDEPGRWNEPRQRADLD
jgi:hypothetical protein